MTTDIRSAVAQALTRYDMTHEIMDCDPELADTAAFCAHYGFTPDQSANTIVIATRSQEPVYVACLVLANCRLDVNKRVRKLLQVRKLSFASPEDTKKITGMALGGVTPLALPEDLPLWIDARVMIPEKIVLGGGDRSTKLILPPQELNKLPSAQVIEDLALLVA